MNRRDFMGTVVGGIAAAKLGMTSSYGYGAEGTLKKAALPGASTGRWIEHGLIDAGGSHEPYLFVVRCGGQSLNAREMYQHQQSEEVIQQLKDQGVEVFHTHLYKGFGMVAEKPEMEDTVRTAAVVHRLGMKIDTYVQWDTMMYETFFAEEPRAREWIQCDALGQPIMLEYGYQQSFRYLPCFSNQEYIDYLKKVVRYAVGEVKTDFIHFDNFTLNAEPNSCHCNGCKTGFRKYLRSKYSPERRKDRFGFENVDYVNPPLWNSSNRPEKLDIIVDPVFQEWIDYRCQTMTDALAQMATLIASLNPEVVVEINYGGEVGHNSPWTRGTDDARLLKFTQVFWDESDRTPEYLPDGRLITTIRTYKAARTYQNIVLTYISAGEVAIAECLAFNQTIGFAGSSPLSSQIVKYISFYRRQRDLYVGTKDVASVAVLRSYASITYHNSHAGLSAILVEQALIQARVPFHLIYDEHLDGLSPATCKVLILPDSECLSDEQLAQIRRYVEAGGGLVATEQTGLYDAWRRMRVKPGLEGLVDNQASGANHRRNVEAPEAAASTSARKTFGRGRVAYFPVIEFDGPLPPPEPYFLLGTEFWKRPKNWKELVDAVYWAAQGDVPLEVTGPDFVGANLVEQPEQRRRLVHLVNYNAGEIPFVEGIEVKCATPAEKTAVAVQLYSAYAETYDTLNFRIQGAQAVFTVPTLKTYCMVAVTW
ncbi:MAG: hypothetical protein WA510_20320 [Acidobacteriaceae bacterium]